MKNIIFSVVLMLLPMMNGYAVVPYQLPGGQGLRW